MRIVLRAALAAVVAAAAVRAQAIPPFARKYGLSCSACHVAWPVLNQVGQSFRDNGYQFGRGKDDPVTVTPGYVPLALRTTPGYQYSRVTNSPDFPTPRTVQHGGVPVPPGTDLLSGGTIAKDVSFLLIISGFSPTDGLASVESAWARLDNIGGSGWLNVKVGKFELDQPASSHRNVTLLFGYAAYAANPQGGRPGAAGFDLGENEVGIEVDGHDDRSSVRYALSFTSANGGEALSDNVWSSPFVWGHIQKAFEFANPTLPWLRVGAFGGVGWWPTVFDTAIPPNPASPEVAGTGRNHKQFYRAGAEISWELGYPSTPALFTLAYMYGQDSQGLVPAGVIDPYSGVDLSTTSNSFHSGFLELDWAPASEPEYNANPWLLFARGDVVHYERGTGDLYGITGGVRRYLALGPRASAAIHLEGHYDQVKGTGFKETPPLPIIIRDVTNLTFFAGIDFNF